MGFQSATAVRNTPNNSSKASKPRLLRNQPFIILPLRILPTPGARFGVRRTTEVHPLRSIYNPPDTRRTVPVV